MEKIVKLKAALVEKIWGGHKLKTNYAKETNLDNIGESWEVSCQEGGMSQIASGPHIGQSFQAWLQQQGEGVLGTKCKAPSVFPILIKFIDAAEALSIQVHPNDAYAETVEHSLGKTEMWLILECEPDSFLYYGVNQEMTSTEFQEHIENNTVLTVLNKVPVKKGDVFFIEAGTIHAIGAGIVICEIQQNSDTTYRVYDFNRTDDQGETRELHIKKAADVSTLTPPQQKPGPVGALIPIPGGSQQKLATSPYFTVTNYHCKTKISIALATESFLSFTCLEGTGHATIENESLCFKKGESFFIPAQQGCLHINGVCDLAVTTL